MIKLNGLREGLLYTTLTQIIRDNNPVDQTWVDHKKGRRVSHIPDERLSRYGINGKAVVEATKKNTIDYKA
jgi:hypothetical protein